MPIQETGGSHGASTSRGMRVIDSIGSNVSVQRDESSEDNANSRADDPALISGMPVGVQIVGGKFGEENAVSVAKAVEEALRLAQQ